MKSSQPNLPKSTLAPSAARSRSLRKRRKRLAEDRWQWRRRLLGWEALEGRQLLATLTWNAATGGDWGVASNWSPAQLPTANDDVIIPSLSGSQSITIASGSRAARTIQVSGDEKLRITGGTLAVSAAAAILLGTGSVEVAGGTMSLAGAAWSNSSTLVLASGTLNLGGSFTQTSLGSLQRSGGTLNLTGTLTGNLALNATTGSWQLNGGTVRNGTVTVDPTVSFVVTSSSTFDNTTLPAGSDVSVQSAVTITNGITLNGRLLLGTAVNFGTLRSSTTQTIAGSGQIVFNDKLNTIETSAGTLTVGAGIVASGQNLSIGSSGGSIVWQGELNVSGATSSLGIEPQNFTNEGIIRSQLATVNIRPFTHFSNAATGRVIMTGGQLSIGNQVSTRTWNNAGLIQITNTNVFLGGTFTQANVGNLQRDSAQAGSIRINGILNGNVTVDATTGPWQVSGGTVRNGTITVDPAVSFVVTSSSTFDNTTLPAGSDVSVQSAVTITNGITLNGRLLLGTAVNFGTLRSSTTQTIAGSGQIVFNDKLNTFETSAGTLTVGAGIVASGQNLSIGSSGGSIVWQGELNVSGATSSLGIEPQNFTNEGIIRSQLATVNIRPFTHFSNAATGRVIMTGGQLSIGNQVSTRTWNNAGLIQITNTNVFLGGTFTQANVGNLQRDSAQAGSIRINGILNGNVTVDATTGPWQVSGGTVRNGTITVDPAVSFVVTSSSTFDNTTLPAGSDVSVQSAVTITNGITLNGRLLLGTAVNFGTLRSSTTQTIAGSGQIVFNDKLNTFETSAGTLTVGAGIVASGQNLSIGSSGGSIVWQGELNVSGATSSLGIEPQNFTNEGIIRSQLATVNIRPFTHFSNAATGRVIMTGGQLSIGNQVSTRTWNNAGLIQITNTNVFLGGTFTQANVGNLQRDSAQAGSIRINGILNGNVTVDATTGPWQVSGGTVRNGTITIDPTVSFVVTGNSTFENTVIQAGTDVSVQSGLNLINGMVLNGRLLLGSTITSGRLLSTFSQAGAATQTVQGMGQIVFSSQANSIDATFNGSATSSTLILENGITLVGSRLALTGNGAIQLRGELTAAGPASNSVTVDVSSFSNLGTVQARDGGTLTLRANALTNLIDVQTVGTNLLSATVQGGNYIAKDGTLRLSNSTNSSIRYQLKKLESNWTISGINANIYDGASSTVNPLLALQEIGSNGSLTISNNAVFNPPGEVLVRGTLNVASTGVIGSSNLTTVRQVGGFVTVNGTLQTSTGYLLQGGTLKGTGGINSSVTQTGGVLAPGNSPGCTVINGNYSLSSGSTLQIEIDGPTVCTQYDQLQVNGTVTLGGSIDTLLADSYTPTIGAAFTVIANDGAEPIVGTFAGLPERSLFKDANNQVFQVSYKGGDGNDVTLSYLGRGMLVTSTLDSGLGSLRQAIIDANNLPSANLIAFSLPTTALGNYQVNLSSTPLPALAGSVRIDGRTQADYIDRPVVEVRGNSSSNLVLGSSATASSVVGLSLTGGNAGIEIRSVNSYVGGNYIGLTPAGTAIGNTVGIRLTATASNTQIGGTTSSDRNVISGNAQYGVALNNSNLNRIDGNFFGLDSSGQNLIANGLASIYLDGASTNTIGTTPAGRNWIVGTNTVGSNGIEVRNNSFTNSIVFNTIGLSATGSVLGNLRHGIVVDNSNNNTVGDSIQLPANIVANYSESGISITGTATLTHIRRNYVGLTTDGMNRAVLPSNTSARGIELLGVTGNTVGGASGSQSYGNVIGGNAIGVRIDSQSQGNFVRSNIIGLGATGTAVVSNVVGVQVDGVSVLNNVGGVNSSERNTARLGNTISGNSTGILLRGASQQTQVVGNWLGTNGFGLVSPGFGNSTVGIHVASATQASIEENTIVQSGTSGAGTNNSGIWIENGDARLNRNLIHRNVGRSIQNNLATGTIEVTQARTDGYVVGRIRNATPNTTYSLEFFAYSQAIENATVPLLERGQAESYLIPKTGVDPILVVTDANGEVDFELLPFVSFDGRLVTATMTPLSSPVTTSAMAQGVTPTAAIIRGLPSRSPEGKPLTLSAFGISNQIAGYSWDVFKGTTKITGSSNAGVLFTPDDEGSYQVKLTLTLTSGVVQALGSHTIEVYNVAPVADFEYQPASPRAGQEITFSSKSNDAGKQDVLQYQWRIRQGSPTGTIVFPPTGSSQGQSEQAKFTPTGGGLYFATLDVADGDGGTHSITRMIEVRGLPDQLSLLASDSSGGEGRSIRVRVSEAELRRAEEFSFAWTLTKNGVAYPSTQPSAGTLEYTPDDDGTYVASVVMTEVASGLTRSASFTSTVANVSPIVRIYEVNSSNSIIANNSSVSTGVVGQPIYFRSDIEDPGKADTHTTSWTITLGGTVVASGNSSANDPAFSFTPTIGGVYTIQSESLDDDFSVTAPIGRGSAQRTLYVPTTQSQVQISLPNPNGAFTEGVSYNVTSSIILPLGVTVQSYNWSSVARNGQITGYSSTTSSLNFVPMRGGEHVIRLTVTLSDGQVLSGSSAVFDVVGAAPSFILDPIQNQALAISPNPNTSTIREGDLVLIDATANDPNETVGITYRWEIKLTGSTSFQTLRALPDNPARVELIAGDQGLYEVRLTVLDSEGISAVVTRTWTVANQTPSIQVTPTTLTGSSLTFEANASDPSPADQAALQYAWSVNGGAFTASAATNTFTTSTLGLASIQVRVTDKDGAVDVHSFSTSSVFSASALNWANLFAGLTGNSQAIVVGTSGNDAIQIPQTPIGTTIPASARVLLFGGDGNDNLDASNATYNVTLVAGGGSNVLRGGRYENRFVGGGSDTMYGGSGSFAKNFFALHFSDVVLFAGTSAITNTIDFSNSNTGLQGVTLNLSSTSGTAQNVVAGSTVALNGFFDTAIGTGNNDTFSASTPGITIDAGSGNDTITIGGSGVEAQGGSGNDTFVLSNVGAAANASLSGGDGDDTFIGSLSGTPSGGDALMIDGGAGSNTVNVQGPNTGNKARVQIVTGEGSAVVSGANLAGSISVGGWNPANSGVRAFGAVGGTATMNVTMSNSTNVDIFGSSTRNAAITVTSSSDVDIFGVLSGNVQLGPTSGNGIGVTAARVHLSQFGSTPADLVSLAISNSSNVDIFGSSSASARYVGSITNSSNVDIFGGMQSSSAVLTVVSSSDVGIFGADAGTIRANDPSNPANNGLASRISGLEIRLSEFGSVAGNSALSLQLNNSTNVDIFGSTSTSGPRLDAAVINSSDVDIFGGTARNAAIVISSSTDVGIFGIADGRIRLGVEPSNPPGLTPNNGLGRVQGAVIQAASDFGSSNPSARLEVVVTNSEDVGIFGSVSSTARPLDATIVNSSDIGIFGSTVSGGRLEVYNSSDIGLFANSSDSIKLSTVTRGNLFVSGFGSTSLQPLQVSILSNSSDVGIFGSSTRNAAITVTSSSDVDIFGGTALTNSATLGVLQGDSISVVSSSNITIAAASFGTAPNSNRYLTATILSSSNVDIFGSSTNGMNLTITNSSDVDIYGGTDDNIVLDSVTRVRVEGGVFGSTTTIRPLSANIVGSSTDVGIFGTTVDDAITVSQGSGISINMRDGDDTVSVSGSVSSFAQNVLVLTDQGNDTANILAGSNVLVYLASGDDRATISGGTNIRVLGGEGADGFLTLAGSDVSLDGGAGDDQSVITGGSNLLQFADAGNDLLTLFTSIPAYVNGGDGDDQIRSFGSNSSTTLLSGTSVTSVIDGGAGVDQIVIAPLWTSSSRALNGSANPLAGLPSWMILPASIANPPIDLIPRNVAALGGAGDDAILLYGEHRLYGYGGSGNDTITLQQGSGSILAGGDGTDTINHLSSGAANTIFGDGGSESNIDKLGGTILRNDTIRVTAGTQLQIYAGEGDDTVQIEGGNSSYIRGGLGDDHVQLSSGANWTLAAESGYDTIDLNGGIEILADGGSDGDFLSLNGGQKNLLLGDSGADWLKYLSGTQGILSGGDGNDLLESYGRDADLYGDDGDDSYRIYPVSGSPADLLLKVSEVLFTQNQTIESDSRGDDTLDLSMFTTTSSGATLNLGLIGVGVVQSVLAGQLQLELLGAFESIVGTNQNDTLTGTSRNNRLEGRGGNDTLIGLAGDDTLVGGVGDDLLDGGLGDDKYEFATTPGASLGSDTIVESFTDGTDWVDLSGMPAGIVNWNIGQINTTQEVILGLLTLNVGTIEEVTGTAFNDVLIGSGSDNRYEMGLGDDSINDPAGDDIYVYRGKDLGVDSITDVGNSRDTLDFSAFAYPLSIDLAVDTAQTQGSGSSITIASGSTIENVVGTSFDDSILGNNADNYLYGGAGRDILEGRGGDDRLYAANQQVVYLDFDSAFDAARGDYSYSSQERSQILASMIADYAPFGGSSPDYVDAYGWRFTINEAEAKSWTTNSGRNYVRLMFSQGRGGSVSGDAGEVDFRNINRSITSEVNVNPLIPALRALLGISPTTPLEQLTSTEQVALSEAVIKLTTTIASHEVSHTAGLRHGDAFGPIGSGLSPNAPTDQIYPSYNGSLGGTETARHLISSPASVGTTIADALQDLYFGIRESIKLAFNEIGRTRLELASGLGAHNSPSTAQDLGNLERLYVPNNSAPGTLHHNKVLDVSALAVIGELKDGSTSNSTEVDLYKFTGKAGDIVNIELMVNSIQPVRGKTFDGVLRLLNSSGNVVALNDDDFEGTKDPTLVDVQLPAGGVYYIEVSRWIDLATASTGGEYELFVSRFKALPAGSLIASTPGDILRGGVGVDRLIGSAADDYFASYGGADLGTDSLWGGGGSFDELDLQGQTYLHTRDSVEIVSNPPSSITGGGPTNGSVGQTLDFEWQIGSLPAGGTVQLNWGDGSTLTNLSPTAGVIRQSKFYSAESPVGAPYQIVITVRDSAGNVVDSRAQATAISRFSVTTQGNVSVLHAGGTSASDQITVQQLSANQIKVVIGTFEQSFVVGSGSGAISRINFYGLEGNDTMSVDSALIMPAMLDGGAGDDVLRGGAGDDILIGGDGIDQIYGNGGRDVIIGGNGRDILYTRGDQDIVVAGRTLHDSSTAALLAISQYWTTNASDANYQAVVQAIRDTGVGMGAWKLNPATTIDDNAADIIYANFSPPAGQVRRLNWYLRNTAGSGLRDSLFNGLASETSTDNSDA